MLTMAHAHLNLIIFSHFVHFFTQKFNSLPDLTILNYEIIPKSEFIVKCSNHMLKYFNET